MTYMQQSKLYLLYTIVLSNSQSKQVLSQVLFWEKAHGMKWVIARYKEYFLELLGKPSASIAKDSAGRWKGPHKALWIAAHKSRRSLRRVLNILKWHGMIKAQPSFEDFLDQQDLLTRLSAERELFLLRRPYHEMPSVKRSGWTRLARFIRSLLWKT
jgi:hypothetical protein